MRRFIVILFLYIFLLSDNVQATQFDKYGGWEGAKGQETGYFHVEKIGDRWWIITPEGNVFFMLGVYCVRMNGIEDTKTGKRPYKEVCLDKYGSEEEWAKVAKYRLKKWNFNTIGDWSSVYTYAEGLNRKIGLAYVMGIDLPKKAKDVIPEGYWGYFPDVFSGVFRDSVREAIEAKFAQQPFLKEDKWLIGYFLADDTPWFGSKQRHEGLVDDYIALDSSDAGKKAWFDFIKSRYGSVEALNRAWSTSFNSLEDLLNIKKIDNADILLKDKLDFLRVIAFEFSRVLAETLREFDKNHMILGMRPTRTYPEIIEGIGHYSDVYTVSFYHLNEGYKVSKDYEETVETLYEYSNKPLILGSFVGAKDSSLPYGSVRTQKDRGISYWRYLARLASTPYVVGTLWFQYFDPPKDCYDSRASNWGLVNDKDEVYEDAVELMSQANQLVYSYALGIYNSVPDFNNKNTELIENPDVGKYNNIAIPIPNNGFEHGANNWKLQTWQGKSKVFVDNKAKHSGKNSLKIEGGPDGGWSSVGVAMQSKPNFILKPGFQYKLSCWIKSENVEDFAFFRIKTTLDNGSAQEFKTPNVYGTQDWKYIETTFTPNEDSTIDYLGAQLVGKGIAWFDDIKLEVIAPENLTLADILKPNEDNRISELKREGTSIPIPNSDFEEDQTGWKFQSWKGNTNISIDEKNAHDGKKSVRIIGDRSISDSTGAVVMKDKLGTALSLEKDYRLSCYAKTENAADRAFIRIKMKYDDGKSEYIQTEQLSGSNDWQSLSIDFRPKKTNEVEYLSCQLIGKGTAWFDDITLEELK